jgi:hypothetical protein
MAFVAPPFPSDWNHSPSRFFTNAVRTKIDQVGVGFLTSSRYISRARLVGPLLAALIAAMGAAVVPLLLNVQLGEKEANAAIKPTVAIP